MRTRALAVTIISGLLLVGCTTSATASPTTPTTLGPTSTAAAPGPTITAAAPGPTGTTTPLSPGSLLLALSTPVSDGGGYCVVLTSSEVDCWGSGLSGQLGDGTYEDSSIPMAVVGAAGTGTLSGVKSLVSDREGYCALLSSGGLDCWGSDVKGGVAGVTNNGSDIPVAVEGVGGSGTLNGVASVSAGAGTYCAVLTSGGPVCWGQGTYGILGDGTTSNSDSPMTVQGVGGTGTLTGVKSVTITGGSSACALLTSGSVDCWGRNQFGSLGDGTLTDSLVPVAVQGVRGTGTLSGVTSVVSDRGGSYCAVLTSGSVDCWGLNSVGQLGNGGGTGPVPFSCSSCFPTPVAVLGVHGAGTLSGVASMASVASSYCALLTAGGIDCWGQGMYGQLGDGTNIARRASDVPVPVAAVGGAGTLSGVSSVGSEGGTSYCAVLTSTRVDCWGDNRIGELGDGTMAGPESCLTLAGRVPCSTRPVAVDAFVGSGVLSNVQSVASDGSASYCVLLTSSAIDCWGDNNQGKLGNGSTSPSDIPVFVTLG
jgi:alpha-tubulin suppressor-like RCC1 family protein